MAIREILLLGNPKLYEICEPVRKAELDTFDSIIQDLHDTLMCFPETTRSGQGNRCASDWCGKKIGLHEYKGSDCLH